MLSRLRRDPACTPRGLLEGLLESAAGTGLWMALAASILLVAGVDWHNCLCLVTGLKCCLLGAC